MEPNVNAVHRQDAALLKIVELVMAELRQAIHRSAERAIAVVERF